MKICIIVDDYMPHSTKAGAKMMHELALELKYQGHEITVITPSIDIKKQYKEIRLDGIQVVFFKSGPLKNVPKSTRAINEALLSVRAWKSLKWFFRKNHYDFIIYYSPSIFFGSLVKKLKQLWRCPSYLILRDIFPQWLIDNGILSENSVITKSFEYFEKVNYKAADMIGVQSKKNLHWFLENYHLKKPLEVLYNWAQNEPQLRQEHEYRKKFGLEGKVVFFYGGNMGHAQDMMNIIRLAKNLLNEKNAHFVLLGNGSEVPLIKESIAKYNLVNMTYLPPVSQDEFKKVIAEFDVGLFSLHSNHSAHNFPGKLLAYMVESMPILGSVNINNDLKDVVEEAEAGFITVNGEDDKLKKNALALLDSTLRKKMGIKSNELLRKNFCVHAAANKILNFYYSKQKNRNCLQNDKEFYNRTKKTIMRERSEREKLILK